MTHTSWIFIIEAVVIVTGNIITIVIFALTPRLRKRQHVLVVSLAVADMFVGLFSIPMYIYFQDQRSRLTMYYVSFYFIPDNVFSGSSLFGLVALGIERSYATCYPFEYRSLSKTPCIIGLVVVWALAILKGALSFLIGKDLNVYLAVKASIVYISLSILCMTYFFVFMRMRSMAVTTQQLASLRNKKLTTTIAMVTFVSLITWIPYAISLVYHLVVDRTQFYWDARVWVKFLQYSNSLVNVFVYTFSMRDFKRELIRMLRVHHCCPQRHNRVNSITLQAVTSH